MELQIEEKKKYTLLSENEAVEILKIELEVCKKLFSLSFIKHFKLGDIFFTSREYIEDFIYSALTSTDLQMQLKEHEKVFVKSKNKGEYH